MTFSKALILGNGQSRKNVLIPDDVIVYGCNHIYKDDVRVDILVSTDIPMQHEIYQSGYAKSHKCVFLNWTPVDVGIVPFLGIDDPVQNRPTEHGVVIGTYQHKHYITYTDSHDEVEVIDIADLPMEFSSGSLAMWHAAISGYIEITIAGFGDSTHCYTENYSGPNPRWEQERNYIINRFSNINWRKI